MNIGIAVMSAMALVLAGCITNTSGERIEDSRVVVDNGMFAAHVRSLGQVCRQTKSGFMEVQVELQNDDTSDFSMLYRFQWLDADGMLIEESSPVWRHAFAHGRDRFFLKGVSESVLAKDFRLVIRNK